MTTLDLIMEKGKKNQVFFTTNQVVSTPVNCYGFCHGVGMELQPICKINVRIVHQNGICFCKLSTTRLKLS